jgi:hypothetical protein
MTQATPPGDSPLFEGLGSEWNDIISAIPEEQRATYAPMIKERLSTYEPLKQWESLQKAGATPDQANTALGIVASIETNPRQFYEAIGEHLGITPQQAKEVVKELESTQNADGSQDNPELAELQKQVKVMAEVMIAERQQSTQAQREAEADKALERDLNELKKKFPDVNEEEVIMRAIAKGITLEQAHNEFTAFVSEIQKRRPAPFVLGNGGHVPAKSINPSKLSTEDTKSLVAQMMMQSNAERDRG